MTSFLGFKTAKERSAYRVTVSVGGDPIGIADVNAPKNEVIHPLPNWQRSKGPRTHPCSRERIDVVQGEI